MGSTAASSITVNGANAVFNESAAAAIGGAGSSFTLTNGQATLAGTNGFTGATTLTAGTLKLTNAGAIASSSGLSIAGGLLQLQSDTNNATFSSTVTVSANTTIDVNRASAGSNNTLKLGSVSFTNSPILNVTGGNGYALALGTLSVGSSGGRTITLNPTTANLTIAGLSNPQTSSGTATLVLDGTSSANFVTGAIANGTVSAVTALTKSNVSTWTLSGASTYTGATTVSGGTLKLASTGSLADTAITINASAGSSPIFLVATGAGGTITAGNTLTAAAGATLTVSAGTTALPQSGAFTMADNAIGTFNLVQGSTVTTGLTVGSATATGYVAPTLTFDIGGTTTADIDRLNVTKLASVGTGGGIFNFVPLSTTTSLTVGNYTFLTASGGLNTGLSLATTTMNLNGTLYSFSLANSTTTAEILTVALGAGTPSECLLDRRRRATATGTHRKPRPVSRRISPPRRQARWILSHSPGPRRTSFFTATTATNLSTALNQSFTINSLTFTGTGTSNTAGTTISPGTGTNLLTINAAAVNGNTLASGITVAAGSGPDVINANVRFAGGAQTWTVNTGATLTINGVVGDGGSAGKLDQGRSRNPDSSRARTFTPAARSLAAAFCRAATAPFTRARRTRSPKSSAPR